MKYFNMIEYHILKRFKDEVLRIFLLKKLKSEEFRTFLCLGFVLGGFDTDGKISTFNFFF
jgi:hypothetical protein